MARCALLPLASLLVAIAVPSSPAAAAGVPTADVTSSWVVTNSWAPFTPAAALPTPGRNPTVSPSLTADGAGVLQAYVGRPAGVFVNRWNAASGWAAPVRVASDESPRSVLAASSGRLAVLVWTTAAAPTSVRVAVRSSTGRWGSASTLACQPGLEGLRPLASADAVAVTGCTGARAGWVRVDGGAWTEVPTTSASRVVLAGTSLVAVDETASDASLVGRVWSGHAGWSETSLAAASPGKVTGSVIAVDGTTVTAAWHTRDCRACAGSSDQPLVDVSAASWTATSGWSAVTRLWSSAPTPDFPNGTTVGEIALAAGDGRAVVALDARDPYDESAVAPRPDALVAAVRGPDGAWTTPRVLARGHWATSPAAAVAGGKPWVGWVRTVSPAGLAVPWRRPGVDARVVALGSDGAPTIARVVSVSRPATGDRMTLAGTPAGLLASWGRQANLWRAESRRFAVPTAVLPGGTSNDVGRVVIAAGMGALIVRPTVSGGSPTAATASFLRPTVRVPPTIRRSPGSLRCVPPSVVPKPRVVTVRWTRNGRSIPGERRFVHLLTAADRGAMMRCVVGISTPASPSQVVASSAVRG